MNACVHFTVHGRGSISSLEIRAALRWVGNQLREWSSSVNTYVPSRLPATTVEGVVAHRQREAFANEQRGLSFSSPSFSRRVSSRHKKHNNPWQVLMLTFKGFRRPTAKLAMPHVHHIDISIVGTELDVVGAQTVYVLQVCPRPILTGAPCARWPLPHAERRGVR